MSLLQSLGKCLPFIILYKMERRFTHNRGILKFFVKWDCENKPVYKTVIVDVHELFAGYYVFSAEQWELQQKKKEYEKKLQCVNEKLGGH